jgi:hypothetical protein
MEEAKKEDGILMQENYRERSSIVTTFLQQEARKPSTSSRSVSREPWTAVIA